MGTRRSYAEKGADQEGWRWWTLRTLQDANDQLTPHELPRYLTDLLRNGPPNAPITVGV